METEIRYSMATAGQNGLYRISIPISEEGKPLLRCRIYDSGEKAYFIHYRNYLAGVMSLVTQ